VLNSIETKIEGFTTNNLPTVVGFNHGFRDTQPTLQRQVSNVQGRYFTFLET